MNAREATAEYRLCHWSQIIREQKESGLSITAFCKQAGFHENRYYYWQKKLREAAIEQLSKHEDEPKKLVTHGFTEVKVYGQSNVPVVAGAGTQLHMEASGVKISIDSGYPVNNVALLIRELSRPC